MDIRRHHMRVARRFLSLLLALALLGVTSASYAARAPSPMQPQHATMAVADCMKMMDQAGHGNAGKHKGCTPADCVNCMVTCAGVATAVPNETPAALIVYDRGSMQGSILTNPLRGRSPPPDIQPPIA
jgi:hypothetical protein